MWCVASWVMLLFMSTSITFNFRLSDKDLPWYWIPAANSKPKSMHTNAWRHDVCSPLNYFIFHAFAFNSFCIKQKDHYIGVGTSDSVGFLIISTSLRLSLWTCLTFSSVDGTYRFVPNVLIPSQDRYWTHLNTLCTLLSTHCTVCLYSSVLVCWSYL